MFQTDLHGGLLHNNLTIFRYSLCAFPVTGFRESQADLKQGFLARKGIPKIVECHAISFL